MDDIEETLIQYDIKIHYAMRALKELKKDRKEIVDEVAQHREAREQGQKTLGE